MHDLTEFQRDLLYVIDNQYKPHGLAFKEELEDYYEKEVHHGRPYPNLDTLVDKGLVEKGQADRRTNYYALTNRAHRELEAATSEKPNRSPFAPTNLLLKRNNRIRNPANATSFCRRTL